MNNKQKRELALALMHKAAEIFEGWDESTTGRNLDRAGIDRDEAAQQIANWLRALPGDDWVTTLPQPSKKS